MYKRNQAALLVINACQLISAIFVTKFLIAHIFMFSNYSFTAVGFFLLIKFPCLFLAHCLSAVISKKFGPVHIKRISSILFAAFMLCVIFFQDYLHVYYMLFGALWGFAQGFFWGGNNILKTRVNERSKLMGFIAVYMAVLTIAKLLFPITFGLIIDNTSLWVVSAIIFAVCLVKFLATFFIKIEKQENETSKLSIGKYLKKVKEQKLSGMLWGFWWIQLIRKIGFTLTFWVTILIALEYGTQMAVGIFWSVFAVVWIAVIHFYKKSKPTIRNKIYWAVVLVKLFIPVVVFFDTGFWGIAVLQLAMIMQYIISLEEKTARLNLPKYLNCEEFVEESHLFGEFGKIIGRSISATLLIIVGVFGGSMTLVAVMITVMMLALSAEAVILFFWNKRYVWSRKHTGQLEMDMPELDEEDDDDDLIACVCVKEIK